MRTGNPALREEIFNATVVDANESIMTIQGTINKTLILFGLTAFSALLVWKNPAAFLPWMMPIAIAGFVLALITGFKPKVAGITSPIYAVLEGLFLGALSATLERVYPGIVTQAVFLTFGTMLAMLLAYKTGLIKVTKKFVMGLIIATAGIGFVYLVSMVLGFFGITIPLIFGGGPVGILFSVVVIVIAAFNLVLDFNFIEQGSKSGAPKYMEWYGAFALMVTLIWLYIEILRLLSKLRER